MDEVYLTLSLVPGAIRTAFDGDDTDAGLWVENATDEQLEQIGLNVIQSDGLYKAYWKELLYQVEEAMERQSPTSAK